MSPILSAFAVRWWKRRQSCGRDVAHFVCVCRSRMAARSTKYVQCLRFGGLWAPSAPFRYPLKHNKPHIAPQRLAKKRNKHVSSPSPEPTPQQPDKRDGPFARKGGVSRTGDTPLLAEEAAPRALGILPFARSCAKGSIPSARARKTDCFYRSQSQKCAENGPTSLPAPKSWSLPSIRSTARPQPASKWKV